MENEQILASGMSTSPVFHVFLVQTLTRFGLFWAKLDISSGLQTLGMIFFFSMINSQFKDHTHNRFIKR